MNTKHAASIDRKNMKRRFKLSAGHILFYGILLAGLTAGLSFFLSASAGAVAFAIPTFLYNTVTGTLYVYNAVALVLIWLFALALPGVYHFTGLADNSWNMLDKFGVATQSLILNKIRVSILSSLATYMVGFLLSVVFGFIRSPEKTLDVMMAVRLCLIGILSLLIVITPALAVGALTHGKSMIRLSILVSGGIAAFLLYYCGYYRCAELGEVASSASRLISANPLGLVIIAAIFTITFPIIAFSTARSRAREYNVEELDDDLLIQLGVAEDILILERGRTRYTVAISGPEINNADYDIPVPPLDPDAAAEKELRRPAAPKAQKAERKHRRQIDDEADDEAEAPEEEEIAPKERGKKPRKEKQKPPKKERKRRGRRDEEDEDNYDDEE